MAAITEADGVFQGGGVKGIALAGALLAFADHGDIAIEKAFRAWLDRELDGATFASVRRDDDARNNFHTADYVNTFGRKLAE